LLLIASFAVVEVGGGALGDADDPEWHALVAARTRTNHETIEVRGNILKG